MDGTRLRLGEAPAFLIRRGKAITREPDQQNGPC
jgi:hypothetical protein